MCNHAQFKQIEVNSVQYRGLSQFTTSVRDGGQPEYGRSCEQSLQLR